MDIDIQSINGLNCAIKPKNGESKEIEFIIENKVGSKENGAKTDREKKQDKKAECDQYYKQTQTERYYFACNNEAKEYRGNRKKIFIYLTPISNDDLSDFDNLGEDQKSKDENFININYQDILDNIIEPLLSAEDISTRIHTLLEEYVLSLSLPALMEYEKENEQNIKGSIIMATRKVDIENIENLIKNHNYLSLIKDALKEVSSNNVQNNLLRSFGETYRKLFTAILRVYIETGNKQGDELDEDELQDLYYQLLGTPKDNTKFSIIYDNKENKKNIQRKGKGVFARTMLKAYINYYKGQNYSNEKICDEIHASYFPRTKGNYCIVLLNEWYKEKEGDEKHRYKQEQGVPSNIPQKIDYSRYEDHNGFLITNQWGLDANAEKDSSFVKLLKDIFGKDIKDSLITTTQNQDVSYKVADLKSDWIHILNKAGIQEITIHINKK